MVVRNLSIAAVALTCLVQTEDWLAQATGSQVQYDRFDAFFDKVQAITVETHPPKPERPRVPIDDPEAEVLLPGVHQLARDVGMSVSELLRFTYGRDPRKKRTLPAQGTPPHHGNSQ